MDGAPVVIKQFMQERQGAVSAFERELAAYTRAAAAAVPTVPRLLRTGMFAHTGALFLALSDEGMALAASLQGAPGGINDTQRAQMKAAMNALHR